MRQQHSAALRPCIPRSSQAIISTREATSHATCRYLQEGHKPGALHVVAPSDGDRTNLGLILG